MEVLINGKFVEAEPFKSAMQLVSECTDLARKLRATAADMRESSVSVHGDTTRLATERETRDMELLAEKLAKLCAYWRPDAEQEAAALIPVEK